MATDVSSFREAHATAVQSDLPDKAKLILGDREYRFKPVPYKLRYGTNPHQPFRAYAPEFNPFPSLGALEVLKGGKDGLSLTNLQDMSQAWNILKYFPDKTPVVIMKHLNPCGFAEDEILEFHQKGTLAKTYRSAQSCDERSAFGGIVGFNNRVDVETAEAIMETFIEGVIAPDYDCGAVEILRRNEGTKKLNNSIRVVKAGNIDKIPKFVGDNVDGFYSLRTLVDGTLTVETPYLTRIRSSADFIIDPSITRADGQIYAAETMPTVQQLEDCLTAWRITGNVRSNAIVFYKEGKAIAVGTGEQERVGAVEKAIDKAIKKGHSLEGAVMASDGFFPKRDSIDLVAKHGVKAVVWPAGSKDDWSIIEAANEHKIALMATLERCFTHI